MPRHAVWFCLLLLHCVSLPDTGINISKFQFDLDFCQALYHQPLAREIAQALPVFLTLNLIIFIL